VFSEARVSTLEDSLIPSPQTHASDLPETTSRPIRSPYPDLAVLPENP